MIDPERAQVVADYLFFELVNNEPQAFDITEPLVPYEYVYKKVSELDIDPDPQATPERVAEVAEVMAKLRQDLFVKQADAFAAFLRKEELVDIICLEDGTIQQVPTMKSYIKYKAMYDSIQGVFNSIEATTPPSPDWLIAAQQCAIAKERLDGLENLIKSYGMWKEPL